MNASEFLYYVATTNPRAALGITVANGGKEDPVRLNLKSGPKLCLYVYDYIGRRHFYIDEKGNEIGMGDVL
jgi:hypothetical protein